MRKTMDKLISWTGLVVAAVLLVAGGLLTWASTFIENNVTEQLQAQHITMPVAAAFPEGHEKFLEPYAGQPLENGQQAKAYADHYILVHMNESSGGKTYSEISGQFMKLAKDPGADRPGPYGSGRPWATRQTSQHSAMATGCSRGHRAPVPKTVRR